MGTILVVEDDDLARAFTTQVLAAGGHRVVAARDGGEALRLAREAPPDLILLDLRMKPVSGREFARAYRRTPAPHAPVVVVSGVEEAPRETHEIGAAALLRKPFEASELAQTVEQWIAPRASGRRRAGKHTSLAAGRSSAATQGRARRLERLATDVADVQESLRRLSDEARALAEAEEAGPLTAEQRRRRARLTLEHQALALRLRELQRTYQELGPR